MMQQTITNEEVQGSFRACLTAYFSTGSWNTPETSAYLDAEGDLAWEKAKAEFDAIQAKDHDYHEHTREWRPQTCEDCAAYAGGESW